jgi:CheY-like chemotaxis protein
MSAVSLPVNRPNGRALVVGNASSRASASEILQHLSYQVQDVEDPYAALAELCRRPLAYRAVILSLQSLYREELQVIPTIVARYPHIEIWLTHTDGRAAALAEASRLGAHGLLSEEGLHRFAIAARETGTSHVGAMTTRQVSAASDTEGNTRDRSFLDAPAAGDPVLTADELRALLQEPVRQPGDQ